MPVRKRAIVTGMIATYPVGGVGWDYGQYLIGLEDLGFDVWYLEDTGGPTYDPDAEVYGEDSSFGRQFLQETLQQLSPKLADRWYFRDTAGTSYGMTRSQVTDLIADSDLFLNVSGAALLRDEYMESPCKVLVDTDPGWNHFVNYPTWDAQPGWQDTHGFRGHDYHFTYAERLGAGDCPLPDFGLEWLPTRPPAVLRRWQPSDPADRWTTVMTWNNFRKPIQHGGRTYGTKEREFSKIECIPQWRPALVCETAVGGENPPISRWEALGWHVVAAPAISRGLEDYRDYIRSSRAELSIAKNVYVDTRCGWFSCRSVCYLAASRPVVVQDTGFSESVPTGEGLFAFTNGEEALAAIDCVESNYSRHQAAAREIAKEYFAADRVLREMLKRIGME